MRTERHIAFRQKHILFFDIRDMNRYLLLWISALFLSCEGDSCVKTQESIKAVDDTLSHLYMDVSDGFRVYYGGAYCSDGAIVIRAAGDTAYLRGIVTDVIDCDFRIEQCPFPREVSDKVFKHLNGIFTDESKKALTERLNFYSIQHNVAAGTVIVGLGDCSDENIKRFKSEIMDSPVICFREIEPAAFDRR